MRRDCLRRALTNDHQKVGIEEHRNRRNFCDSITSVNGKSGHNVSFNGMPDEHKQDRFKRRNVLSVTAPDEEEKENDHISEKFKKIEEKESNAQLKSQQEFSALSDNAVYSSNIFYAVRLW